MTVAQVLAWQSSTWLINDALHSLGAFITSSGAAGIAAVTAAVIAARQVQRTRANDIADRKREDLWQRFEWVVDNSTTTSSDRKPALTAARAVAMLVTLRNAAKPLGDDALVTLIQDVLDHLITGITAEVDRNAQE